MKLEILASTLILLAPVSTLTEQQKQDEIQSKSAVWMKLTRQADDYTKKKDYAKAKQVFEQIMSDRAKLGLDLSSERASLAKLYVATGDKQKAEELYKANIADREEAYGDDDFTLVYPLNEYANFLASIGRKKEATALNKRADAIEADSQKPPSKRIAAITGNTKLTNKEKAAQLVTLGKSFFERDNALKARFALNEAIKLDPSLSDAYVARSRANGQLEEMQAALNDLNKAISLSPKNAEALADRARIYQNLQKPQLALKDFTASIAARPNDIDTIGWRAKQYDELGQRDKAIADYSTVLKIAPDTTWALVQRADVYKRLKNYPSALADLNRVIVLRPKNSDAIEFRTEVQKLMNKKK